MPGQVGDGISWSLGVSFRKVSVHYPYIDSPISLVGKPVLASWMGGPDVAPGAKVLNDAGIPTYAYPDMACRTFNYMHQYQTNLESNYDRIDLKVDLEAVQVGPRLPV